MNRIAIVGPGAIGTLFAALFSRAGHTVCLVDHRKERAARIASQGIAVTGDAGTWHASVQSTASPCDFGTADAVFICTKAHQTASTAEAITPLIGSHTTLVSLQNGMGNAELIEPAAPGRCVCGVTAMGAILDAPGLLHWTGHGATQLAPFKSTPISSPEAVATLLTEAGCECHVLADAESLLWGKLIINAAINPVTAIHGIPNGEVLNHAQAREQAFAAAREAKAVADARGIALPYGNVISAVTDVCTRTAANRSSMLCDVEHHRHTEVDAITGAIIREANRLSIPVPVNENLLASIEAISHTD